MNPDRNVDNGTFSRTAAEAPPQQASSRIVVDRGVAIPMRDGVPLVADVYRPASGRHPVLMQRTPYGRATESGSFVALSPVQLATAGFCVVIQDTRGRGDSGGSFEPFGEIADGYDTAQWAAEQPWSTGQVGAFGSSYLAATQLQAAASGPSALRTICPVQASSDYFEGRTYWGGALEYGALITTSLTAMLPGSLERAGLDAGEQKRLRSVAQRILDALADQPVRFPIRDLLGGPDGPLQQLTPWVFDWVKHDRPDTYWQQRSVMGSHAKMRTSALHITSWYDQFHTGTLTNYLELRKHPDPGVANGQYLIIGPWHHFAMPGYSLGTVRVGDIYFGAKAAVNLSAIQQAWFEAQLSGRNSFRQRTRVRYFLMAANEWRGVDDWPVPGSSLKPLFLGGDGRGPSGGILTHKPGRQHGVDAYRYDPAAPVPTRGGAHLVLSPLVPPGPVYQNDIIHRDDVLSYQTTPLATDLDVVGPISAHVYVMTDAVSTDWVIRLADVDPAGRFLGICDGIARAGGDVVSVTVSLGATAYRFRAGHRIALLVTSSNFPRYDPNPNTGESSFDCAEPRVANQTILHGVGHPSQLILPVVTDDSTAGGD
jgi:putative CocE/NonD family hydrolase